MDEVNLVARKLIFVVSGGDYTRDSSGTSKVVKAHERIFMSNGYRYAVMFPLSLSRGNGIKRKTITTGCYGLIEDGKYIGAFTRNQIIHWLSECQNNGMVISGILLHHIIRSRIEDIQYILECIENVKVVFYVHDYYSCCVNFNLLKNDVESCVGRLDVCNGCIYQKYRIRHVEKVSRLFKIVENRIMFVAPSQYVKSQWVKYYSQYKDNVVVIPHLKAVGEYKGNIEPLSNGRKIRVAYIGAQSKQKGWPIWKKLVSSLSELQVEYDLYYFGNGEEQLLGVKNFCVEIHRQGKDAMVRALREKQIDIVFLGSVWGETYSYTLYEAHAANCFILAMQAGGNISYVVENENWGKVFLSYDDVKSFLVEPERTRAYINHWKLFSSRGALQYLDNDAILNIFDENFSGKVKSKYHMRNMLLQPLRYVLNFLYIKRCKDGK